VTVTSLRRRRRRRQPPRLASAVDMFRIPTTSLPPEFSGVGSSSSNNSWDGLLTMPMLPPAHSLPPGPQQLPGVSLPVGVPFPHQSPLQPGARLPHVPATTSDGRKRRRERNWGEDAGEDLRETRVSAVLTHAHIIKTSADGARWLTLCLPEGKKMAPYAVGIRKDPCDPAGQATLSTPLYLAKDIFEHVVDPNLQRSSKWKRWQKLWKKNDGKDGPLVEHAVFIRKDGTCAASSTPRSDALVGLNGLEVLIDAVAGGSLTQRPRDFFFFETPPFDAHPARQGWSRQSGYGHSPLPPAQPVTPTDELVREAIDLLREGMVQGLSQAAIELLIDGMRLQPERAASLREATTLALAGLSGLSGSDRPELSRAVDGALATVEMGPSSPLPPF
jgi:hypothetical protein